MFIFTPQSPEIAMSRLENMEPKSFAPKCRGDVFPGKQWGNHQMKVGCNSSISFYQFCISLYLVNS
jgi:hypothetical protein